MQDHPLYQHLAGEAGQITWQELQPHFARGVLVVVSDSLDLIEVATCIAQDDHDAVAGWSSQGQVVRATDDHARCWALSNPLLCAVVVAPWVLVQLPPRH
jgi:hypothetical protein